MLSNTEPTACSILSNDTSNLKKKQLVIWQAARGILAYISIKDVGINYPNLVNCFFSLRA